jgi:hypothetical protein
MDFAKAFDKVNHSLLIHKLRYYGIDGKTTRWIQNWLEDRQQTVELDGVSSEAVSVDSGVPQGSVLGPGLFLFYINDLQSILTSKVRLFADDTIIYLKIPSIRIKEQAYQTLVRPLVEYASTVPWGTPESTLTASDETPSSTTVCCLSSN